MSRPKHDERIHPLIGTGWCSCWLSEVQGVPDLDSATESSATALPRRKWVGRLILPALLGQARSISTLKRSSHILVYFGQAMNVVAPHMITAEILRRVSCAYSRCFSPEAIVCCWAYLMSCRRSSTNSPPRLRSHPGLDAGFDIDGGYLCLHQTRVEALNSSFGVLRGNGEKGMPT